MDSIEKTNAVNDDGSSGTPDERQSQSGGVDSGARPSLSQVKKSWGFRRTTIARREFMEEVGDLTHSPPLVRRGRSRRAIQAPETNTEDGTKQKTTRTARSVIEDLQWSAPSSPVSEDSKEPSETSAGGAFDPSLWQDLGSAFHTAFSLLGGNEGLSLTDALAVPAFLGPANEIEPTDPQPVEENEVPENLEDMDITQPVAPDNVTERESDYVVLISSQEEDSDEMTLLQIKEQLATSSRPGDSKAREEEKEEEREALETRPEPEAEGEPPETEAEPRCEMETDGPLCTGPGCVKQALPDSVYCGTDCILQHAAITMKTLSCPKVPKSKERPQRKTAAARPPAKVSERLD
ncbi:hypothetical protein GOODEAATRI_006348 [Goodea atripinnis]|uniref:Uncharacterized protein n=1 Tax=Goodea atripinnis TaxID=208336 RepID=A0ABV0N2A4_9TELE